MRLGPTFLAIGLAIGLAGGPAIAQPAIAQPDIDAVPATGHPAGDYEAARAAFAEDPLTGGCLFYRAQYRFRVHLAARPGLDASGESALMGSLNEVVGRPINEWLGGDPDDWIAAMDCAIAWARAQDDPFTPKAEFGDAHREVLAGLVELRDGVAADPGAVRGQRALNGLPNR